MRWSDLVSRQPAPAEVAHRKLIEPGALLVGTVRRDGTARISGVEPLIMDDQLWLSMMIHSTKAHDLYRDPRLVLNSLVTGPEPAIEIKVRGVARLESDPVMHERCASAVATRSAGDRSSANLHFSPSISTM